MGENSKIGWTHHTFNPWWGCTKISSGCAHCYAATFAKRLGTGWGPQAERRFFAESHWNEPFKWQKQAKKAGERRRVFCASMADVFEEGAGLDDQRYRLWKMIELTPDLDWLLLTKRPENINRMVPKTWAYDAFFPRNIWMGTSVEDQAAANTRIPHLLATKARIKFLSVEPMVNAVDLRQPAEWLTGLDWIICGGESGIGARDMKEPWAAALLGQVQQAGKLFFMKQMGGEWDKREELEDLPSYMRVREFPK